MKVQVWAMGAPSDRWVVQGELVYQKRIERYMPFEYKTIQVSKATNRQLVLADEAKWLTQQLDATPTQLILLDERGPQLTSNAFATQIEHWRQGTHKRLLFLIGSAYGFDQSIVHRAHTQLGLSAMTLPHQLCRLILLEQIYRACTILRGESYHHE